MRKSIDNLAQKIDDLVEKNIGNGNNSKKGSLTQSLKSDCSKNTSGKAYYKRRDINKKIVKKKKIMSKEKRNLIEKL